MNRRLLVALTAAVTLLAFAAGAWYFSRAAVPAAPPPGAHLVRTHSPVVGPADAPVTVVEFFDPSCEACRAFHPYLKQILDAFPRDVRLVLRYTPLHEGSDEAVRILEAARLQGRFDAVLAALLQRQPEWAQHGAPDLALAWRIAGSAGLDLARAQRDARRPDIDELLRQDMADVRAAGVQRTPSFFVNGEPLREFGPQPLYELVRAHVERARAAGAAR